MIDSLFHENNRRRLSGAIPDSLIVLTAYNKMQRSNDSAFGFKQEANFWWLTGIEQPDWLVIIDGKLGKSWLVPPDVSGVHKIFDGSLAQDDARAISGIDNILNQDEASTMLVDLSKKYNVVYMADYPVDSESFDFTINPAQQKLREMLGRTFTDIRDCNLELAKLRAIKQPVEIEAMKKAIKLTIDAFVEVKQQLKSFKNEYEVEAEFSYYFRKNGADGQAFDPIVASGGNACTLHYIANNYALKKDNLLLIDIGAQVGRYSADISRTYSLGEATDRQIAVHQAVDQARQQIIELLRPGLVVSEYQNQVEIIMKDALDKLGLLSEPNDYRRYFPHSIGHGLGVDTHDSLGQATEFLSGMVITVEPGIYIPEENIGVRIEDDILITDTGHINLTACLDTSL